MTAPSGDQHTIAGGGYEAVVTESGGALRSLSHAGRPVLDGFAGDEMASGGRGQLLMPWPSRIRDGRYVFAGTDHQLALTEPKRHNASHGLVRWAAWSVAEHTDDSVALGYRLMAQSGYPWTVDVGVRYDVSAGGLVVTQSAVNRSSTPAPMAFGAHPYLTIGVGPVDLWELTLPAAEYVVTDDRMLPVEQRPVAGTPYDFRAGRAIGTTELDHAFTELHRDSDGTSTVLLRDPATGREVALWVGEHHRWLQVFTADEVPATARRSLAVEPMTAGADAFNSGEDLVVLAPEGESGDALSASWGVRAVDESA